MARFTPTELAEVLGSGLLSFPVTHFNEDYSFNEAGYRDHVEWLDSFGAAGLFAAGGAGEFFALDTVELPSIVRAAVESTADSTPIIAPAGRSVKEAIEQVKAAEEAGADGILLFPPYLTESSQEGLYAYVRAVASSTTLGVIIYSRANAVYRANIVARLAAELPNFIGYKDGVGNIELMTRVYSALGDRLLYIGGLPTAETFALPYLELGVTTYSSALYNVIPRFALEFFDAVKTRDRDRVYADLNRFVLPYLEIRDRNKGYAVSIIKAGMKAIGRDAGPVRPPLTELTAAEQETLAELIEKVR